MTKKSSPGKSKRLVIGCLLAKFRFAGAKPAKPKRSSRPKPKPKVSRRRRYSYRPKR